MEKQDITQIRALTVKQTLLQIYETINETTPFVVTGGFALYWWKQIYKPSELDDFGDVNLFFPIATKLVENQAFPYTLNMIGKDFNLMDSSDFFGRQFLCRFQDANDTVFHMIRTHPQNNRVAPIQDTLEKFDLDICRIGFRIAPSKHGSIHELGLYNKQQCLRTLTLSLLRLGVCRDMRAKIVETAASAAITAEDWQSFFIPIWYYGKTWNIGAAVDPAKHSAQLEWKKSRSLQTALERKLKYTARGYRIIEVPSLLEDAVVMERELIKLQAADLARQEIKEAKRHKKKVMFQQLEKTEKERLEKNTTKHF